MVEEGSQTSSTADVCQTCGHPGFIELLLCCNKCHISKEHRYCLAVLADEDEFIYTCPRCTSPDAKQTCYKPPLPNAPPFRTFLRTNKRQVQNLKKNQVDHSCLTTVVEAEVQKNDISPVLKTSISEPSVNNLAPENDQRKRQENTISSPAEIESPVKRQRKSDVCLEESDEEPTCIDAKEPQEVEQVELVETKRSQIKDEEIEDEELQALVEQVDISKRKRSLIDDEEIEDGELQQAQVEQVDTSKRKRSSNDDKEIKSQELQPSQLAQVDPVKRKRSSICHEENKDQELQVHKVAQVDPVEIQSPRPVIGSHNYVYAQPIINSAWRGYFEIGKENFGRLEAHFSNKACLKVYEAAKVMPEVISVKIIPRREAWPKSFNASSPTDENIALYFFPGIISAVKAFDERTRHIIERDLAMRVLFDNAELLIFPSTQLPLMFRRFNGKHYLWGVFKGREASHESGDTKQTKISVCSSKKISVQSSRTSPVSPLNYSSDLGPN